VFKKRGLVMKRYIIPILCLSLALQGCFTRWDTKDRILFGSLVALHVVDGAQSWDIWDGPERSELNPGITSQESLILVKLAAVGFFYAAAELLPKYRTSILSCGCMVQGGVDV